MESKSGFSLRAQLFSLVILITLISFIGSLWSSIESTRSYINQQMHSHAQDTATSLGLSISPYMNQQVEGNSMVVATMISAIFDNGYYASIRLTDVDDKTLVNRSNGSTIENVPNWFVESFPLNATAQASEINDGWQMAGILSVKTHSGSSYQKLWQHAVQSFYSSLAIGIRALLLAHLILKSILQPLNKLEQQALDVTSRQFHIISQRPLTRELRIVTLAMNNMVTNIQQNFEQMTEHAQKLADEVFIDHLTTLGNRRSFNNQFSAFQQEMNANDLATLGLVQIASLQTVNNQQGFQQGDVYVCEVAEFLNNALKEHPGSYLFRANGSSFFFMIKGVGEQVVSFCEHLKLELNKRNSKGYQNGYADIVATAYESNSKLSAILSQLDTWLTQEQSVTKSGDVYRYLNQHSKNQQQKEAGRGLREWSELLKNLTQQKSVELSFQPIVSTVKASIAKTSSIKPSIDKASIDKVSGTTQEIIYYELFSLFEHQGEALSNNQLHAMAERLEQSQQLDKQVLMFLAEEAGERFKFKSNTKVAINLSHQSLYSDDFKEWLVDFILTHQAHLPALVLELNEEDLLSSIKSSQNFIKTFKHLNVEICIQRFGASVSTFKYLKDLNVDYIKLDASYINDLETHHQTNHFIQAVVQIAHGVGIRVIAPNVEQAQTLLMLKALHCDGVQGNIIQPTLNLDPIRYNVTENKLCINSPIGVKSD